MAIMATRGFRAEDFARLHPGGMLGKRLLWTVKDIMHKGSENPVVRVEQTVREALTVMTKSRMAILFLVPAALAIFVRATAPDAPAVHIEFVFAFMFIPQALLPLVALLYASGVIQDELEEQTITSPSGKVHRFEIDPCRRAGLLPTWGRI